MVHVGLRSGVNEAETGGTLKPRCDRSLCPTKLQIWHMFICICLQVVNGRSKTCQTIQEWPQSAVRIPVEFELPGDEAIMHRDGDRLVIEPVRKRGLVALLATMKPLDDDFPEMADRLPKA